MRNGQWPRIEFNHRSVAKSVALCPNKTDLPSSLSQLEFFGHSLGDGAIAQLVEHLVRNEKVSGSNPLGSTIPNLENAFPVVIVEATSLAFRPHDQEPFLKRTVLKRGSVFGTSHSLSGSL
jgi:hypothetical protein